MSTRRHYWAVVKEDLDVLNSPRRRLVNEDLLEPGYIPAYPTIAGFLEGDELVGDCCAFSGIGPRVVVQVEADGVEVIIPWEDQEMDATYVKPLSLLSSTPLQEWLEQLASEGAPPEREGAAALLEDIQISIDNPLDDED